jgi:hypothetical protein
MRGAAARAVARRRRFDPGGAMERGNDPSRSSLQACFLQFCSEPRAWHIKTTDDRRRRPREKNELVLLARLDRSEIDFVGKGEKSRMHTQYVAVGITS